MTQIINTYNEPNLQNAQYLCHTEHDLHFLLDMRVRSLMQLTCTQSTIYHPQT